MNKLLRTVTLAILVSPALASAQVSVGLRLGYGLPSGDLQKDSKLTDQLKSQVPIQLDLLYRFTEQAAAGLYASYGFDQVAQPLKDRSTLLVGPGASYHATTTRVGVQGTYSFPVGVVVPWVGVGSGIEIGNFDVKNGPAKITGTTRGWEWINVQVGGDYMAAKSFGAGLFASWSVGKFTYQGGEVSGTGSIFDGAEGGGLGSDAATHTWVTFGIRGKFDL